MRLPCLVLLLGGFYLPETYSHLSWECPLGDSRDRHALVRSTTR